MNSFSFEFRPCVMEDKTASAIVSVRVHCGERRWSLSCAEAKERNMSDASLGLSAGESIRYQRRHDQPDAGCDDRKWSARPTVSKAQPTHIALLENKEII
jgi:hypothetical protein